MKKIERLLTGILIIALIFTLGISIFAEEKKIDTVNFTKATVNADTLNLRQGPSESMTIVAKLQKSQVLEILGKTDGWYFVYDPQSGKVGCVSGEFITPVTAQTKTETKLPGDGGVSEAGNDEKPTGLTNDESILYELVSSARDTANAGSIKYNKDLAKVAYDKAKDMVENNYFSHESKIYGSPFEMMRSYGIKFVAGAENIAGNQSVEKAFYSWMSSDSHKNNIINPEYTDMGIGVYISPVYGKIIVQMFIKS